MIGVDFPDDGQFSRSAFRTQVPNLSARIGDKIFKVKDLSVAGIAVFDDECCMESGTKVEIDLMLKDKVFLKELPAEVVRAKKDEGFVGLSFYGLDRRRQALLDKLVLEVQKRVIVKRKKQIDQDCCSEKKSDSG